MAVEEKPAEDGTPSLLIALVPILFSVVLLAVTVPHLWRASAMDMRAPIGGPFSLVASDGRTVTEKSWPGRFLLIYFGYTHCPAACPTALADMQGALDAMGRAADRIQPVFVTVDPARDGRETMGRYVAMFGPHIEGLTGSADAIASAERNYGIEVRRLPGGTGDAYAMEHSSVILLMRPDGTFGGSFRADEGSARLARDLSAAIR